MSERLGVGDDIKWTCHVCTYENWASSAKCTMCLTSNAPSSHPDNIYRLQEDLLGEVGGRGGSCGARAVTPDLPAWACPLCTYHNMDKSARCLQCETPRPNRPHVDAPHRSPKNTNVAADNSVQNMKNDRYSKFDEFDYNICKISKSNSQNLGCTNNERTSIIKSNSQNIIESSYNNSNKKNLDIRSPEKGILGGKGSRERSKNINSGSGGELIDSNILADSLERLDRVPSARSLIVPRALSIKEEPVVNINELAKSKNIHQVKGGCSSSMGKWRCHQCTYENWPKTVRCAMCGLGHKPPPERSSPPHPTHPPHSPLDSPDCDNARGLPHYDENINSNLKRSNSRRFEPIESVGARRQLSPNNLDMERQIRLSRQADWSWLEACLGVVDGDPDPVESYLRSGGDPARYLTPTEVAVLNRPSAFDVGHTLVHLAIRFQREELLAMLLSRIEGSGSGIKRVPSYVAPDLAADIRRYVNSTLRQRKGSFPSYFVSDITTFSLPAELEELPASLQNQLYEELLDKEVQNELESDPAVVNWSLEITVRLGSRLYALWNRSAGDCLLDSVMQATWGVFDRDNVLRRALGESLEQGSHLFYPQWKEYEERQAAMLHFSLNDEQYKEDWATLLSLACQPGSSLDQLHVFALSHILRRPIIVYGVKYVKSFRGENLGFARFEGVYLPLLWEPSFCVRSPLALGYTRGHFSALVPLEPYTAVDICAKLANADHVDNNDHLQVTFLPLMDSSRKTLPVHFLAQEDVGKEESVLRKWLDVCVTEGGIMVAQQKLQKRPLLVAQMLEEWLNHYRRINQMTLAPFAARPLPVPEADYSSEGESDDE